LLKFLTPSSSELEVVTYGAELIAELFDEES
jgi:hypothetical protein